MKMLSAALFGIVVLSAGLWLTSTPALALGGCGPNAHRDGAGRCVPGGQNEDWCIRKTGHPATRMPNGTMKCL
ncbi:GCG_CRPN prefix-to-repeats domain-containing protein [Bradyrhizobium commune]|uniref:Uncharacterized protein n=1 Tax=Bradyrhizobium commune TaxID=83627 RepID=A0A7S9D974_9BRAD|nr:hypothetical protein [Bradyrhizobium commune]QPF93533.1 hypothetical protein IC761_09790 [Bradyrhizobium commune]